LRLASASNESKGKTYKELSKELHHIHQTQNTFTLNQNLNYELANVEGLSENMLWFQLPIIT
jgi:hypothetical protein